MKLLRIVPLICFMAGLPACLSDGPVEPDRSPSFAFSTAEPYRFFMNDKELNFPVATSEFSRLTGDIPEAETLATSTSYRWDHLGISASEPSGGNVIDDLLFRLGTAQGTLLFETKGSFPGRLLLDSIEICSSTSTSAFAGLGFDNTGSIYWSRRVGCVRYDTEFDGSSGQCLYFSISYDDTVKVPFDSSFCDDTGYDTCVSAEIFFASIPPVADIYVDDSLVGQTNTRLTSVCAGTHTFTFVKGDTCRAERRICLQPGRNASWMVRLSCAGDGGGIAPESRFAGYGN